MKLTQKQQLEIVMKAMPLISRLQQAHLVTAVDEDTTHSRMDKWAQKMGGVEKLHKRLAWDGLNPADMKALGATTPHRQVLDTPDWIEVLNDCLEKAASVFESSEAFEKLLAYRFIDRQAPQPYEELFVPFVLCARQKLLGSIGYDLWESKALADLERSLLKQLCSLSARCLEFEFSLQRATSSSSLSRLFGQAQNAKQKKSYKEFIEKLLDGGLTAFFQEYAALARQIALTISFWVVNTQALFMRLASDWPEIQATFAIDSPLVKTVEPGLSDPHYGQQTVMILTFVTGQRLVYKPKNLGAELAYFKLWAWFNPKISLPFPELKVLYREHYGWVEAVTHEPCQDRGAVGRYYRRAGMLLCLLYIVEATDCLYENVIANGEYPVLVDMETLLHRRHDREYIIQDGMKMWLLASELLQNSVLRTGFLPQWYVGPNGETYDGSGLGATANQNTGQLIPQWENVNTDGMKLGWETAVIQATTNSPKLNGKSLNLQDFQEDLISGFQEMYQVVLENREALLAADNPLACLAKQELRFLYRNTRDYQKLLNKLALPNYMRDGFERSLVLESLVTSYLDKDVKPAVWPVCQTEIQALEQGDIPHFTTSADSYALKVLDQEIISNYFSATSLAQVYGRLPTLDTTDLAQQVGFIQASLYAYSASPENNTSTLLSKIAYAKETPVLTNEELVQQSINIANEMIDRAVGTPENGLGWIAIGYNLRGKCYRLQPIEYNLYNGIVGIALFFAALHRITKASRFQDYAMGTLKPLQHLLQHPTLKNKLKNKMNIGGIGGLGSLIYALVNISHFLRDDLYLENAQQVASLLTSESIQSDIGFDIINGAAGTLCALLTLYQATHDEAVLRQAIQCAEHLLDSRAMTQSGQRVWSDKSGQALTGFSHGTAGIAYALTKLYDITRDSCLSDAAKEAIYYEQLSFCPEEGNWLDFGPHGPRRFMNTWCHGAPGIGLGRLGILPSMPETRPDIMAALSHTEQTTIKREDHLCCGNLGRMELFCVASQKMQTVEWHQIARQQVSAVVARANNSGSYGLFTTEVASNLYNPGFFRGMAGIGYQLLRVAYPDQLPSILLLE